MFQEIAFKLRELNASVKAMEVHMGVIGFKGYRIADLKAVATRSEECQAASTRLLTLIDGLPFPPQS